MIQTRKDAKNDNRPITTFVNLTIATDENGKLMLRDDGKKIDFQAYMNGDKNKVLYQLSAADEMRQEILQIQNMMLLGLKEESNFNAVATLRNYLDKDGAVKQSFNIMFIDMYEKALTA